MRRNRVPERPCGITTKELAELLDVSLQRAFAIARARGLEVIQHGTGPRPTVYSFDSVDVFLSDRADEFADRRDADMRRRRDLQKLRSERLSD